MQGRLWPGLARLGVRAFGKSSARVIPALFEEAGAIAVSGAAGLPVGHQDEACAGAGLRAMSRS